MQKSKWRVRLLTLGLIASCITATWGVHAHAETSQFTYSGHLRTNSGVALAGVAVQLGNTASSVTDSNGAFEVTAPEGYYPVRIATTQHYNPANIPGGPREFSLSRTAFNLTSNTSQELTLPLVNLTIKTAADIAGTPVASVQVMLHEVTTKSSLNYLMPQSSREWFGSIDHLGYSNAAGEVSFKILQDSFYVCSSGSQITANFFEGSVGGCGGRTPGFAADSTMTITRGTPSTPRNVVYKGGFPTNTPIISWDPVNYGSFVADHYDVYRDGTRIGSTTESTYTDYAAPEGEYNYAVKSIGVNGAASELSSQQYQYVDKTAPAFVSVSLRHSTVNQTESLYVDAVATDSMSLFADHFSSYGSVEAYLDTDPGKGNGQTLGNISGLGPNYTVSQSIGQTVTPGLHTLFVRATDNTGNYAIPTEDNWSESVALPFAVRASAPTNLAVTKTPTNSSPVLNWQAVDGADHYNVYRDDAKVGTVASTSFVDTTLTAEGTHRYFVRAALSDDTESDGSNAVNALYDTTSPTISHLSWTDNPLLQGLDTTLSIVANDDLGSVVQMEYFVDSDPGLGNATPVSTSSWSVIFGANLGVGTYTIGVRAKDAAGNWGSVVQDVLAVYTSNGGHVAGHARLVPQDDDYLPIERDTSAHPARLIIGFSHLTGATSTQPASGSFDTRYVIKNKKNEFSLESTTIDWVAIPPSGATASMLGHATMVSYADGVKAVLENVAVRFDVTQGSGSAPDRVRMRIFEPGADPAHDPARWFVDEYVTTGSNIIIQP